jgi:hypothetical protein
MNKEMIQVFAKIESETGLRAFEMYMDLRWAEFWVGIIGPAIVMSAIAGVVIYLFCRYGNEEEGTKEEGSKDE